MLLKLDCIRPLGMFVSFGNASGPIDAFPIGLLQQKGSLFATRPKLNDYVLSKGFQLFPSSTAARGAKDKDAKAPKPTLEQVVFAKLGLAIVDKAVQRMGGTFELVNAPDGGLMAHIRLKKAP